jgi:hypothetical protein
MQPPTWGVLVPVELDLQQSGFNDHARDMVYYLGL